MPYIPKKSSRIIKYETYLNILKEMKELGYKASIILEEIDEIDSLFFHGVKIRRDKPDVYVLLDGLVSELATSSYISRNQRERAIELKINLMGLLEKREITEGEFYKKISNLKRAIEFAKGG